MSMVVHPNVNAYINRRNRKINKKLTANQKANLALSKVNKIQRQEELKYLSNIFLPTAAQMAIGTGSIWPCALTQEGVSSAFRLGQMISPTSLALRMQVNSAAGTPATTITVFVGVWKPGVAGGYTSFMEYANPISFKNRDYRFSSRILWQKTFTLENVNNNVAFITKKVKLTNKLKKLAYVDNAAPTSPTNDGLYIGIISDQLAANAPVVAIHARLYFRDL